MQDWPGDLPAPTLPGEEDRLCQTQIWGSQEGCLGLAAFDPKPQSSQGLFALQVQSLRRLCLCPACKYPQMHLWRSCWRESWLGGSTYVVSFGDGNSESVLLGSPGSYSHSLLLSSLFVLFYFLKQIRLYRQPEPVSLQMLSMFLFRISPKWTHLHF